MSDNKKYYYLKFKENYFDQDHIKVIESMSNGYEYSLIILKLYLKSLKFEGQLKINEAIPYQSDKIDLLAGVLGHDPANVMHAINLAKDLGVMDVLSTGDMFMSDIQSFIGHGSTEAERKKLYREKVKKHTITDERDKDGTLSQNRPPELELELEREKEIDKYSPAIQDIIDYLNSKCLTAYRKTSNKTNTLIKARLKDGFTIDNFRTVIDNKSNQWLNTDSAKYLRPETLFGTKFEGYLNEKQKQSNCVTSLQQIRQEQGSWQ